jgi:two-component system, cell cycle sensor histidine kinase and response regulator CckA
MTREKAGNVSLGPTQIPPPFNESDSDHADGAPLSALDRFADVLRWAPIGIFRVRKDGTFIAVNQYLVDMLGYASRSELAALNLERDVYFDPSQRRAILILVESRGTDLRLEVRWRKKDGSPIWVELTGHAVWRAVEEADYLEGLAIDITERKLAEEALRESERKMSTLLSNLPGIAYRCRNDRKWTMEFISEGCRELTGYSPYDLTLNRTLSFGDLILPEDREGVWEKIQESLHGKKPYQLLYRISAADGKIKWVWEKGEGIRGASGELEALEGFITDITERKSAEERVREQAALLERAQDAIYVEDPDGVIGFWNRGAGRIYGWSSEEACGRKADSLLRKEGPAHVEIRASVLEKGEWVGERTDYAKDGRAIIVECRCSIVRDDRGGPVSILVINTDITEKKKLERQFFRSQRMESIGTLAAGIAHDLNNVLAPISMSIAMLRNKIEDPAGLSLLDTIDASAVRAGGIVKQVLGFGRGVEGDRVVFQPGHVIIEILKIATETFPKSIDIQMNIPKDLWTIVADPTQMHQVLLNLCLNGRDAMPCGGILKISAENVMLDERHAKLNIDAKPGRYVSFSVGDTGTGIPAEAMDRIFDPFFTTKPPGKGTGLGLPTALAIIRSHGGFINVETEKEKGTTFRVYLPAQRESGAPEMQTTDRAAPAGRGELILVVDDEPSIREITRGMLESKGYSVLTACNGSEAVELYLLRKDEIRATITDLMMPVMDGSSVIRTLRELDPDSIIIAPSGFVADHSPESAPAHEATMFIRKPYTAEKLLQVLDELFHTQGRRPLTP